MSNITRRIAIAGLATPFILPRFALAQADNRPSIVIAVQKISNSNTLDVLREGSNVGERIFFSSLWEGLIGRDWLNGLGKTPLLATEWRRIDDTTVELDLRKGVKFHNGDEMTAEDVAFSFGPDRMFGDTKPSANPKTLPYSERIPGLGAKDVPPEVFGVARRAWPNLVKVEIVDKYRVRFINGSPDVTLVHDVSLSLGRGEALGVVGESGCGKSVTFLASLGLLPAKARAAGLARLDGDDILNVPAAKLESIRGRRVAMIFQDPSSSLNPVLRIGHQIGEVLGLHRALTQAFLMTAETRRSFSSA